MANSQLLLSFAAVPAGLLSAVLTWAIRPLMRRIALAKPNARSSHRIRTPQGAGVSVIATTLISAVAVIAIGSAVTSSTRSQSYSSSSAASLPHS